MIIILVYIIHSIVLIEMSELLYPHAVTKRAYRQFVFIYFSVHVHTGMFIVLLKYFCFILYEYSILNYIKEDYERRKSIVFFF